MRVQGWARSARERIAAGDFEAADEPLQHWLEARPDSAEALFLSARVAIGLNRFEPGLKALQKAREAGYPDRLIERERGLLLVRGGNLSEAEPVLRKVFLASSSDTRDPELDEALARCYVESYQLRAAEEVLKRWIRDAPTDARPYFWSAEVERRKATPDQDVLIDNYEKAVRLDPAMDQARLPLAEQYLKAHRNDDAAREYAAYVQRHPDDPEAHLGLGQIAAENGDEGEAIRELDRAAELAPGDHRPLVERGKLELHRGRVREALTFFSRAVEVNPTEPEVHYQRGLVLTRLGKVEEAKKEQEETARRQRERGELELLLKDLHRSPRDLSLQIRACRWLFDHGHPDEGLRWAEKILREHPGHVEICRLLADHYERAGNAGLANFYRVQATPAGAATPLEPGPAP
jgi:Flp pilus assembly protein TadD